MTCVRVRVYVYCDVGAISFYCVLVAQLEKVAAGNRDSAATAEAAKTKLAEEKSKVALLQQQVSSARDQLSLKDMELSGA